MLLGEKRVSFGGSGTHSQGPPGKELSLPPFTAQRHRQCGLCPGLIQHEALGLHAAGAGGFDKNISQKYGLSTGKTLGGGDQGQPLWRRESGPGGREGRMSKGKDGCLNLDLKEWHTKKR